MKTRINHLLAHVLAVFILSTSAIGKNKSEEVLENKPKQTKQYKCKLISRSDAIRQAKKQLDGKVVGVKLNKKNARSSYRVRILVGDKRVKTLSIRACR